MLKLLIVDDEILVRLALKSSINWESNGFKLIGEAENGLDALNYIEKFKPDIVLTDISMPHMNGIELIKHIKEKYPQIEVIILSCHNDFDFVREGMKLGAVDYILKLSMKLEDLIEVLNKVKEKINLNTLFSNDEILVKSQDEERLNFVLKLLNNNFESIEVLYEQAKQFEFPIKNKYYLAVILQKDKKNKNQVFKQSPLTNIIDNIIKDVMSSYNMGIMIPFEEGKYLYIFSFGTISIYNENISKIENLCKKTITLINKFVQIESSCGIGGIVKGFENLKLSYEQAYEELKMNFYTGKSSINIYDKSHEEIIFIEDMQSYKILINTINILDINNFKTNFINWLLSLNNTYNDMQVVKKYIHKIILSLENNIKYLGLNEKYTKSTQKAYILIQEQYYLNEIIETIAECIDEFVQDTKLDEIFIYRREVMLAKEYIQNHYYEEIKISTISKYINMNSDYFSHIFKKETTINFTDYLNKVRIEKAKEYMKTKKYKIYEIAHKVGYSNESYFVKKFKEETGFKPMEYIKKLNNITN